MLFGIATNLLRHHLRSEARRLRAYARVDRPPDIREIAAALAQLSTDERDVLLLFAWADLRYEEIAVALQMPIGTVRSRLNRARGRLRELIGRSGQYQGADHLTEAIDTDG